MWYNKVIQVVKFSIRGYKIKKIFAHESNWDLETCRKSSFEKISEKVSITFYFILLFSVNFFSMHGVKIQNVTLHCMHDSLLCRKHV